MVSDEPSYFHWLRGPARIDDGWLVLSRERASPYVPMFYDAVVDADIARIGRYEPARLYAEPKAVEGFGLVFDLAGIRHPGDALRFIDHHGLLWHGLTAEEHRERYTDWEAMAVEFTSALDYYRLVTDASEGDTEALDELRAKWEREPAPTPSPFSVGDGADDLLLLSAVTCHLAHLINSRLVGVEIRVAPFTEGYIKGGLGRAYLAPGRLVPSVKAPNLSSFAAYELARLLSTKPDLARCPVCARVFNVPDKRQRYCSSECANRARYQRYLEKHGGRRKKDGQAR